MTEDEQSIRLIEEHVRRLLSIMGFTEAQVHCSLTDAVGEQETIRQELIINVTAGDAGKLLIGPQGANLASFQHVVRCVMRRHLTDDVRISLDVNGYKERRAKTLHVLAESAARRATTQGRTVVLRPMFAHERRAVHTALAARDDVQTESMGDEPNRRVVVKPVFM